MTKTTTTYFISGHRDITSDEFNEHYVTKFTDIITHTPDDELEFLSFVVGDYYGTDQLAMDWLWEYRRELGLDGYKILVYHMLDAPRVNNHNLPTVGGFQTDIERDTAMTRISDYDIAWVRPGREGSGTDQNIQRRKELIKGTKEYICEGAVTYRYNTVINATNRVEASTILKTRLAQGAVTLEQLTTSPEVIRLK